MWWRGNKRRSNGRWRQAVVEKKANIDLSYVIRAVRVNPVSDMRFICMLINTRLRRVSYIYMND